MGERRTVITIGVTISLALALLLIWAFSADDLASGSLTEVTDRIELARQVQISGIGIATGENFVGHRVRVIHATIKNTSDKPLRLVDVKMVFSDYDGKSIQESVQKAFEPKQKPLVPGSQYRFEINFENLPKTWNYHVPSIEVVKIGY